MAEASATKPKKEAACESTRRALMIDPASLRDDPDALVNLVRELQKFGWKMLEQLERERRARYGPSSERSALLEGESAKQKLLFDPELPPVSPSSSPSQPPAPPLPSRLESAVPKEKAGRNGRRKLPKHLPVETVRLELAPEDRRCPCCNEPMQAIGEEESSQLEFRPASFFVLKKVRVKYACRKHQGEGVLTAEPPPAPIAKGLPGPGLLAHVVTSKMADHLPLHRQAQIFARQGVEIARSTLTDWIGAAAKLLEPIADHMARAILKSVKIHSDETPIRVQEKGRKTTRTGRLWVYIGDDAHPFTIFDYTRTREKSGPERMLAGFRGFLQADGYAGYDVVYAKGVVEVACWAHVRRKFWDARTSDLPRAATMLHMIGALFAIERELHGRSPAERLAGRVERSAPLTAEIKAWLDEQARIVLPKSSMGQAIAYTLNNWEALTRFLSNGALEVDNNRAERALRGIAVGRKNYLFLGSDEGGRRAAVLYSIIETCKAHRVNPFEYLRDVLQRLPTYRGDIAALTPPAWKQAREAAAAPPPDS